MCECECEWELHKDAQKPPQKIPARVRERRKWYREIEEDEVCLEMGSCFGKRSKEAEYGRMLLREVYQKDLRSWYMFGEAFLKKDVEAQV